MTKKKEQKLPVWAVIILVIFYPFGLVFLIYRLTKKLSNTPDNFKANSRPVTITAYILIFFGIIYLVAGLTGSLQAETEGDVVFGVTVMLILFCGGGIGLLVHRNKCKKLADLYDKYVPCITGSQVNDIARLASMVGVTYDIALGDLKKLLGFGALKDAYMDLQRGKIILPNVIADSRPNSVVICPHCGGSNKFPAGQIGSCEYCDMPLK